MYLWAKMEISKMERMDRDEGVLFAATVAILGAFGIAAVLASAGCGPVGKTIAKGAIDVAVAACIAEFSDVDDESTLKDVCKITDDAAPYIKELLSARSKGLAKKASALKCPEKK